MVGGLLMAVGAAADSHGGCSNFVEVEIYTQASSNGGSSSGGSPSPVPQAVTDCPDPTAMNPSMDSKLGIFDSPDFAEMEKIFDAFKTYVFSAEGTGIIFHPVLRGDVKGRTPKPDKAKIKEFFGTDSLATTQKLSPVPADPATEQMLWGGIQ